METTDVVFDKRTVDTQLAKQYIETRSEFHSIGFTENGSYVCDKFNNKIFLADMDAEPIAVDGTMSHSDTLEKLFALANMIEKKADLFCQLEFLIRGNSVGDVKKWDLKLIIDNLLYFYKTKRPKNVYNNIYCNKIALLADTPLAVLGFFAQSLFFECEHKKNSFTIISNKDTAIIGSLFVDLCRQVGFGDVFLQLVSNDADCSKYNVLGIEEMSTGCVGIVTNMCDVDSAVDTFISSTVWYPWRVNKIFVQECVLERFKRALSWRTESVGEGGFSYKCGNKVFSLEAAGVVSVEAYRTVRELLTLLGALKPLAVSLWSSDVAESLEIAHGLNATIVWVNDFADFRGPPWVSQAFYSVIDVHFSSWSVECVPELETIEKLKKTWLRRSTEERETLMMGEGKNHSCYPALVDRDDVPDSFISVSDNFVVTSTIKPALIYQIDFDNTLNDLSVMKFLIKGGGLLVKSFGVYLNSLFQDIRKIKDIPIVCQENSRKQTNYQSAQVLWKPCYEHKVIWNNYGTTFAN